jgi:hypothetical protein
MSAVDPSLSDLLAALCDETIAPEEAGRLDHLICTDAAVRRAYLEYLDLHARLSYQFHQPAEAVEAIGSAAELPSRPAADRQSTIDDRRSPIPPIRLDLSPTNRGSLSASLFSPGGFLFPYLTATAILGICLLIGLGWKVSRYQEIVRSGSPTAPPFGKPEVESQVVGRVTGMAGCEWVDPATAVFDRDDVPLGQKYSLALGLLEITYDSGAKVIIQGPATYEVASRSGGFLSFGRLTALVQGKGSGSRVQGPGGDRLSAARQPQFSVYTPTAVVTDLGTEFGVEVDRSGTTKSHVFQGKAKVRLVGDGGQSVEPVLLGENEGATVEAGRNRTPKLIRATGRAVAPGRFVRQMSHWVPIQVFSTGAGLKVGDPDPHWELVARSDNTQFKPHAAVVAIPVEAYLSNNPARSQWVSTHGRLLGMPRGLYTFRTTFKLDRVSPESAVLQGKFLADNHVDAVRLNGRDVPVPVHSGSAPFREFHTFTIDEGFIQGINVLEIVVFNNEALRDTHRDTPGGPMALRVELRAFGLPAANFDNEGQGLRK